MIPTDEQNEMSLNNINKGMNMHDDSGWCCDTHATVNTSGVLSKHRLYFGCQNEETILYKKELLHDFTTFNGNGLNVGFALSR